MLRSIACLILISVLFGCAAPGPKPSRTGKVEVDRNQIAALNALKKADSYREEENFARAAALYAEVIDSGALLPAKTYYDYGYVLNRTERYAEAIKQFRTYLQKAGLAAQYTVAANREMAFADTELSLKEEQMRQLAEKQAREQAMRDARQALPDVASKETSFSAALQSLAPSITEPLTGMELRLVEGGCYLMGDQFGDGDQYEQPVHEVCVDSYYLGITEVTQGQWKTLMGFNPATHQYSDTHPVENISWQEVQEFLQVLNRGGRNYRLPSEAEWEYAARSGGDLEKFSGGQDVDLVAWYRENSEGHTHPVARKVANGLGLHDMSGNVAEWCQRYRGEDYVPSLESEVPVGPLTTTEPGSHWSRGGDFSKEAQNVRTTARRGYYPQGWKDDTQGFRVLLPVTQPPAEN